jgi:hypothetical protein
MNDSQPEPSYAPWAEALRASYARHESAFFVLHDNIADVYPLGGDYIGCRPYLEAMLERGKFVIIHYDVSRGMRFRDDAEAWRFVELANQNLPPGQQLIRSIYDFPKDSIRALAFIEAFIVGIESSDRPVAVIIEYAEHLAPNGDPQTMTEVDRINTVTLQRFARLFYERLRDPKPRDAVAFLLVPDLHNLHPDLVRSELVVSIDLPRPGADERRAFVSWQLAKAVVEGRPAPELEVTEEQLVELTAGLTLTGIDHLFLRAIHAPDRKLCAAFIAERKREIITRDSRGMLEILSPRHGLDAVGGSQAIKEFLENTARDLRQGMRDVPVGVVCPGPNGVGKTFIAKAFAHDAGVNAVALRNFRGMYVGQTESNLDTIFNILKAMTPNIVIIDEADKTLGNERGDAGSQVDERVFGAFTAFMGDPEYRGKIFWLLLTARPFGLAPDTGRPGRVEEHLPILAPETLSEKRAVLAAVTRASGIHLIRDQDPATEPTEEELRALFETLGFVTPAALELVANRSRRRARRLTGDVPATGLLTVPFSVFCEEARNYVPEGSLVKQRLQTIEAVLYTNDLSYLPEPWRSRLRENPDGLAREREELAKLVGYV